MSSSNLQRTFSRIRSKLGFRSPSRSSTKKPSLSKIPTLRKEEETVVGEEKGARSDHTTLKEKEGELSDKKDMIGGSNVKGHEITRARESQDQLKNGENKLEDLSDSLPDETVKGKSKRTGNNKVHDAGARNREKENSTSFPFQIANGKEVKMAMEGAHIEKEKPTSAPPPDESREKEIKRVSAVVLEEEQQQGHGYIVQQKEDSKPSYFPLASATEEIKMAREGEKQAGDRSDGGKEQSISAFPDEIRSVVEEKQQVDDTKIKGREDSTSSPFTKKIGGGEGIKTIEEVEEPNGGRRERGKEEPPPAPLANGTGAEEITRERGGEEQAHDSRFGQKEDSTLSRFPIENGKVKEDSTSSLFTKKIGGGEGIKTTEEVEEPNGGRRERGKEEPPPAPLANGTGAEEITRERGGEEQAHDSRFGQREDSTSSRFPIENGKEENKVTEKGEEQDADNRDRGKEESISATSPNESGREEIKRMKGGQPTSLLPIESATEKMNRMDERFEQGVDIRTREKELTSSPLQDKSGWTAMKRMTKREGHAIDRREKEKEDSAPSPLTSETGREETNWVSKGEGQEGGWRNQDEEDSTSSPPSLMPMPKSEEVPLGGQHLSSLPSEATADQERKISETREGQTSVRSHQIKEDSVLFPLIPVLESKAIDVGDKMPQTAVSSSPKQIIEEGWRLERGDKAPETKEGGGKAEHIASPSSGEDLETAGSSIEVPKSIVTRKGEEILKDHKELEPFLLHSGSKEEIKRMNEGQLVPKGDLSGWKKEEDSMPMLDTNLREADTSLYSSSVSTAEEEERSRSKSMVVSERAMPTSSPVSTPTSEEDLIGESDRLENKGIRSKEGQEEEENRKISKIIQDEITSVGERQALGLLEHEMLITLGNGSITSTLLGAIKETIHKEIEELRSTLFLGKEELKGQVEGGEMICRKTHLKTESDKGGRERDELSSREKLRRMSCPSSASTTDEEDAKKSDVEWKSGEKTQVPRRRDGKAPKEIEGRKVVEEMRDGEDERNEEKKGGASYGSSSGKALRVLGAVAALASIGTVVLMKRLENARKRKYK